MHIWDTLQRVDRLLIWVGCLAVYNVELELLVLPDKSSLREINGLLGFRFLVSIVGFLFHSRFLNLLLICLLNIREELIH